MGRFPGARAALDPVPKVWGTDGRKMSKSYGNSITMGEDEESTRKKIMSAMTDPARVHRSDPGEPTKCGIYYLHRLYSTPERVAEVEVGCRSRRDRLCRMQEVAAREAFALPGRPEGEARRGRGPSGGR